MSITIRPYTAEDVEAVRQFNRRLRCGGLNMGFFESCLPHGLAKTPERTLYEEHFLAFEGNVVRGGYGLKHQDFWIGGRTVSIADFWLPISEGTVDKKYVPVAAAMLLHAQKRQPLLYGLGMGGYDTPLVRLLLSAGWKMFSVPFFFRVVHPIPFLENLAYLRRRPATRRALDALAFTGLGWLGIHGLQKLRGRYNRLDPELVVEQVDDFSSWADELWQKNKGQYGMSAVRDSKTLQVIYPDESRFIRLRVRRGSRPIGFIVLLNTALSGHNYFGNMRLGSIVSCFGDTTEASKIVRVARATLESQDVDLIVSNHSHAMWCRAFRRAGFLGGPSNFIFAVSPQLADVLKASNVENADIHLNRGDGDGPTNL
jgi:hypothetical protein